MKKKNKHKSKYWKGFPEELRLMCLAEVSGRCNYCTRPVLDYLSDNMYTCDAFIFETTPYDVIRWIDVAVESCLFPLEHYEEEWIERKEDIRRVLERSEELINRVAPPDYKDGYITSHDQRYKISIVNYAQKLTVYFCVLYMYTGEWQKLKKSLNQLLLYTEHNVLHMMSYEKAEEYAAMDDLMEYHYVGMDAWEPLNWLCKEFIPGGRSKMLFAEVYEEYALFLHALCSRSTSSKACSHLCEKADERLRNVCNQILDELNVLFGEPEEIQEHSLVENKAKYEEMIKKIDERDYAGGEKSSDHKKHVVS